jgi:hypothetical protein
MGKQRNRSVLVADTVIITSHHDFLALTVKAIAATIDGIMEES